MAAQDLFLDIAPSTTLHVQLTNPPNPASKPALVFLHYWGGSHRTFHHLTTSLSPTYPLIALDHRGWGLSIGPTDPSSYSIKSLAQDVLSVLHQLSDHVSNGFVLVGHSMGAKVALAIAATKPNGLKGMILIAPAPSTPLILPEDMRAQQKMAYESRESVEWTVSNVLSSREKLSVEDFEMVVADSLKGNQWAKAAWPEYGMSEDVARGLEGNGEKVLMIAGEEDVVETKERVFEVGELLKERGFGVRVTVVSGVRHLIPLESPGVLIELIEREF